MFWNDIEEIKEGISRLERKIDKLSPLIEKLSACACEVSSTPIRCDGARVFDDGIEDVREIIDFALERAISEMKEKKSPKKKKSSKKVAPSPAPLS